ncbi:hypothetical protein B0H19DRAFT_1086186 [Mycena capillaripes]|nr:hypothetical protein B0H19DRAFT_1086186 [Mycena capillaripes]
MNFTGPLSRVVRDSALPYLRLFMRREFSKIHEERATAEKSRATAQKIHSDAKSPQARDEFCTSYFKYYTGGNGRPDYACFHVVEGDRWYKEKVIFSVRLPPNATITVDEVKKAIRKRWSQEAQASEWHLSATDSDWAITARRLLGSLVSNII